MKKLIPGFVILTIGICIAFVVKANQRTFVPCCWDNQVVCRVIGSTVLYGPLPPRYVCP
jgi:hypothetical protein